MAVVNPKYLNNIHSLAIKSYRLLCLYLYSELVLRNSKQSNAAELRIKKILVKSSSACYKLCRKIRIGQGSGRLISARS